MYGIIFGFSFLAILIAALASASVLKLSNVQALSIVMMSGAASASAAASRKGASNYKGALIFLHGLGDTPAGNSLTSVQMNPHFFVLIPSLVSFRFFFQSRLVINNNRGAARNPTKTIQHQIRLSTRSSYSHRYQWWS